jgi:hypothetical protein
VDWLDVLALVLGVVIAGGLAYLVAPLLGRAGSFDARHRCRSSCHPRTPEKWRGCNALIAAHPTVAPHLPPAV